MKKKIRPKWEKLGYYGGTQEYKVGSFRVSDAGANYHRPQDRFLVAINNEWKMFPSREAVEAAIATATALSK